MGRDFSKSQVMGRVQKLNKTVQNTKINIKWLKKRWLDVGVVLSLLRFHSAPLELGAKPDIFKFLRRVQHLETAAVGGQRGRKALFH